MKVRNGFVSNSSSSSFVVIGYNGDESNILRDEIEDDCITLGEKGEAQFGWGPDTITDMYSRINFAFLQAEHNPKWMKMLNSVIGDAIGNACSIVWNVHKRFAYIDHQSSAVEGRNTEMFDDEDSLKRFLFCEDSEIYLNNDNY